MPTPLRPKPFKPNTDFTLNCSFRLERESGFSRVAGIDEVGRGCLAGPVVVAGVVFPRDIWFSETEWLNEVDDSKKLSAEKRVELADLVRANALAVAVGSCDCLEIDNINILQATFKAARQVVKSLEASLGQNLELILMDGSQKISQLSHRQHTVVSGDRISKSIAAASIVAKVHRDQWMRDLAEQYPGYGFEKHKGYGTREHLLALRKLGASSLHRKSFLKKLEAVAYGREGENRAVEYLKGQGFRILEQNWKTSSAEIDIVAEKNKEIHFMEVRYRSQAADLPLIFPSAKQAQIKTAVQVYMLSHPEWADRAFHIHFFSVGPTTIVPYWDVFGF